MLREIDYPIVEKALRSKNYGVLGTIDTDGFPHSTSVLYAVSKPEEPLAIYIVTGKSYKKLRNIEINPKISFVIPFPHYILRFVPPNCIQFQGTAEILPINNEDVRELFLKDKVLRMTLESADDKLDKFVFLKIYPRRIIYGYGLDIGMNEVKKDHTKGSFKSTIPSNKLSQKMEIAV